MDSGNSGSLQSSSGGDGGVGGGDVHRSAHFNSMPFLQPRSNFFDLSSFSQNPNPNPNPMYNLDSLWSGNQTSNPVYDLDPQQDPFLNTNPVDEKLGVTAKNPKKRTRASRRAPTTVLTTDTTNFRQMVQQYTGIPDAPFSASSSSSPFARRLDLYTGITPVHPLRPSAQKIQLQQPSYTTTATTSIFQLPPSETHGITKQSLNLSNLQNQMFPFQSLSQSTLQQQVNLTERENRPSEHPDAFVSSSSTSLKRWRGEDENMMNFEGRIGNSENDQLTGNEDSWICPSD